jgi:hypothetical protein
MPIWEEKPIDGPAGLWKHVMSDAAHEAFLMYFDHYTRRSGGRPDIFA